MWVFEDQDCSLVEPGDILFLARQDEPNRISHAGLVEEVDAFSANTTVLHASQAEGRMARAEWQRNDTGFKDRYLVKGTGKIGPFLFRLFLQDEFKRTLIHDK
jgi:hypothetical protein